MKDIIVKSKPVKKIVFFIGSILFVFVGFFEIGLAFGKYDLRETINIVGSFLFGMGIVTILFFGYGAVYYAKSLKDNVALKVTENGIYENTSSIKWGLIEWEDVESIELIHYLNQTFIEIKVRDIEKYMSRLSKISLFFQRKNIEMGFEICIVTNILNYNPEVLCALLQEYHQYVLGKRLRALD